MSAKGCATARAARRPPGLSHRELRGAGAPRKTTPQSERAITIFASATAAYGGVARAFAGGSCHTGGDHGVRDDEGSLFFVDRLKDRIVSGGETSRGPR
jgi:acyl-CoA synthetase (AMP-forming)/AMP-acid ligase II